MAKTPPKELAAPPSKMLSLREVAQILGTSVPTVWRRVEAGLLRVYRDGRIIRVDPGDLDAYIEARKSGGDEQERRRQSSRLTLLPVRGTVDDDEEKGQELAKKFGLIRRQVNGKDGNR